MSLGSSATADGTSVTLNAGQPKPETFEVRLKLSRSSIDTTLDPHPTRWTLESNPAPGRGETFVVYFQLFDKVKDRNGIEVDIDTLALYEALIDMEHSARLVAYQDAGGALSVLMDDHDFFQEKATDTFFDGTFAAKHRRPDEG